MTTALDKITKHFKEKLSADMGMTHVPEWDLKIYFKTSITLKEQSKLIELAQAGKTTEALVETLITKARNEDGSKMFNPLDKSVFMNEADPSILIRVVGEINQVSAVETDLDEVEKN